MENGNLITPKFKVEFINPITQSQRSNQNNSIDALLMSVMNMAQANPAIIDRIDFDQVVKNKSDILQVDPKIIRNDSDVEALRSQRDQAMAQQQQAIMDNTQAQTAKTMTEAGL